MIVRSLMVVVALSPVLAIDTAGPASTPASTHASLFSLGVERAVDSAADPAVIDARGIDLDLVLLAGLATGHRLSMAIPETGPVVAIVDRVHEDADGALTIRARLEDRPLGEATFVLSDGAATGFIRGPQLGVWRVRPDDDGHVLLRVDHTRLPGCAGAPTAEATDPGLPMMAAGATCEDGSQIDMLILYTRIARISAGGVSAIEGEINLAVDRANQAYENSDIGTRIRMVHLVETDYDESGDYSGHLTRLANGKDGYMDEAPVLREEHAADLVALIVDDGQYCGIAWLMPANTPASENLGFSVTTWYCAANLILAHEVGHNMGCCHAPGDGGGCSSGGLFEYSVGYRFYGNSGNEWRTVMAYAPGDRISHFSNPEVSFDGQPTGVSADENDAADNGRTINETSWAISNYRNPPCAGDIHRNCTVDFGDIIKVLSSWGMSGVPADQNGDGIVDFADILFVLTHWGPCEY